MLLLDPVFLVIIFLGILTSYTDIKHNKIKNIYVILLILSGLLINIFWTKTLLNFPIQVLANSFIALILGFLLWDLDLLSPGDAKLFFAFSLLVPITSYKYSIIPYFPSFNILINTFVPVTIFYLLYSMFRTNLDFLKKESKKIFNLSSIGTILFFIFLISVISILTYRIWEFRLNLLLSIVLLFLISEIFNKIDKKYLKIFYILSFIIAIILLFEDVFNILFLKSMLVFFIIFQLIRLLIYNFSNFSSITVKINDLKPGMSLAENIKKKNEKYEKDETILVTHFDILRYSKSKYSAKFKGKLTEEGIRELKELKRRGKLKFDSVKVTKRVPFAPFMFLGVLMTYFLKDNILTYLVVVPSYISMYAKIFYYKLLIKLGIL